ncbi:CHAT domain-containing protein [Nakamurella sp. YIM 132087]|uniref:CHAT domain-containing protein n=1 Tax=Nakamurella alba TaxID=2665158 RepID=A0A7K1FTT4_9ACTN|nr:CHAT domain-containing protein [Nakamurella alba]MTD16799.1 CHAT domain-containing protein [Nakamurella alba]
MASDIPRPAGAGGEQRGQQVRRPRATSAASAEELWTASRQASDRGHWDVSRRFARRALAAWEAVPGGDPTLRVRILIALAYNESELGRTRVARALLDQAASAGTQILPAVRVARGLLHVRTGRPDLAIEDFDRAIAEQRGAESAREQEDLAGALINRGLMHMSAGRLSDAAADTAEAGAIGRRLRDPDLIFMADHNLGYVRYLGGDLPGALSAMESAAAASAEGAADGVSHLDRARALTAAGMVVEAGEFVDHALAAFRRNRATADLVEAYAVRAELDLMAGEPAAALDHARKAATIAARRGNDNAALASRVLQQRARRALRALAAEDGTVALPGRAPGPAGAAGRAGCAGPTGDAEAASVTGTAGIDPAASRDARSAGALADELAAAGMPDDRGAALLLQAEALLDAGRVHEAAGVAAQVRQSSAMPQLAARLHHRYVDARIALAHDDRRAGFGHIRRGLDELARFQARFGSQDLQSASAVHGADLAALGLRTAVRSGSPATIFQWLERARGVSTRLPQVRPPADPVLAEELGALRVSYEQARQAVLSGRRSPALETRVRELRRAVRARAWEARGNGAVTRPPSLTDVQRRLAADPDAPTVVAYIRGGGVVHALVIGPEGASFAVLGAFADLQERVRRLDADLDLLASGRVPAAVRAVAGRSLEQGLSALSATLVAPIAGWLRPGPLLISGLGVLATVPWSMLPGLHGRPITVNSSVTASMTELGRPAQVAGVLSVAGPGVPLGGLEVEQVAAVHPGSAVLVDGDATGSAVLREVPDGGLLHIAAHGRHEAESPLFSSVLLADGPLYGYDIAPNPDLPRQVVLSSCEVGRNDVRIGEPLGLAAALLRSGVSTVIAGVSRIGDEVAAEVMTEYHRRLAAGDRPAFALAGAVGTVDRPAPFSCFGAGV